MPKITYFRVIKQENGPKCGYNSKAGTITAFLLQLRLLFESGYYSRAGSNNARTVFERKTVGNTAQNHIRNHLNIKSCQIVLNSSKSLDEKFRAFVPNFFYSKLASGGRFWRSDPNKRTLQKFRVALNKKIRKCQ